MFFIIIRNFFQANAASEYILAICDKCTPMQMQSLAANYKQENQITEVQVVNADNGTVAAFNVMWTRETGFERVDVFPTDMRPEVDYAAVDAQAYFAVMEANAEANSNIINKAEAIHDFVFFTRVNVQRVPSGVATSAEGLSTGSLEAVSVSQYLSGQIPSPSGITKP